MKTNHFGIISTKRIETAHNMGLAAMAGRQNKLQLCAGIGSSSSVTNDIRRQILSSTKNKIQQRFGAGRTMNAATAASPVRYAQPKQPFSMKYVLLTFGLFIQVLSYSQTKEPVEVTPALQKKIMLDIDKEVLKLKQQLAKEGDNAEHTEFTIDTFRVERFMAKWIDLDYGDFGMRDAGYAAAKLYDSLLNKYYKKLLTALKGEDKKALVQAQKAWISFRDSETRLVETISKDEYSGGGTMQQLTEASEYLNLIKNRTIALFEHYVRATQSY